MRRIWKRLDRDAEPDTVGAMDRPTRLMDRRTKIIATIGPASDSEAALKGLIHAGMDVARLGLAHESLETALERFHRIRRVAAGQSLLDPSMTTRVLDRLRHGQEQDERIASLTAQERRILDLLAEGLTNRQIGERLHLAEKTVKNYVSNVLMKLGMERRTEAAVYAARQADRLARTHGTTLPPSLR